MANARSPGKAETATGPVRKSACGPMPARERALEERRKKEEARERASAAGAPRIAAESATTEAMPQKRTDDVEPALTREADGIRGVRKKSQRKLVWRSPPPPGLREFMPERSCAQS